MSVPSTVLSAFNTHYPNATQVQWKLLSDGTYKAEFLIGNVKWQAIFTASGTWLKNNTLSFRGRGAQKLPFGSFLFCFQIQAKRK
jgi:hypothetical protein